MLLKKFVPTIYARYQKGIGRYGGNSRILLHGGITHQRREDEQSPQTSNYNTHKYYGALHLTQFPSLHKNTTK